MKALTRLQTLEKQNRDYRTRLENREGKAELALCAAEEEIKALKAQLDEKEISRKEERKELTARERDKDRIIAMLQKEIAALTRELEAVNALWSEKAQGMIGVAVAEATAPLLEEIAKAHAEIARLKAIVNKDSSNSSKPPGTNGFKQIQNSREKSGRARGGQVGHPGHRLGLPDNLDELAAMGIIKKQLVDYTGGSAEYVSRYVIDVEVTTTVTEYRYSVGAQLPERQFNEVSYGDNIKAMSVLLLTEGIIAEMRLSAILEGLTQGVVTVSPATLERFKSQFAEKLESGGEMEAIRENLLNGELMHTDDTPLRCAETAEYLEDGTEVIHTAEGKSFKATIRTYSSETATLYTVNPKKDKEGIERDGLLPKYLGRLSHDHESKFYNYGTSHSTCGEHLLRDLKGLRDLQMIPWAEDMRTHIAGMNTHKNKDLERKRTQCDPELLAGFEQTYDNLLERGRGELALMQEGSFGHDEFRKMLNRLTNYKDCYLLFMRDYKAPFTNNLAERDLRTEKTKEKVSLLFRSWNGIKKHAKIRSFISTAKKRGMDLFAAITKVYNGLEVLRNA